MMSRPCSWKAVTHASPVWSDSCGQRADQATRAARGAACGRGREQTGPPRCTCAAGCRPHPTPTPTHPHLEVEHVSVLRLKVAVAPLTGPAGSGWVSRGAGVAGQDGGGRGNDPRRLCAAEAWNMRAQGRRCRGGAGGAPRGRLPGAVLVVLELLVALPPLGQLVGAGGVKHVFVAQEGDGTRHL